MLCWLAVAQLVSSGGIPANYDSLDDRIEQAAGILFGGENNELEFLTKTDNDLSFEQKMEIMGIDSSEIHPSIREDAKLLVVSSLLKMVKITV